MSCSESATTMRGRSGEPRRGYVFGSAGRGPTACCGECCGGMTEDQDRIMIFGSEGRRHLPYVVIQSLKRLRALSIFAPRV
jgi:hypothetical protein